MQRRRGSAQLENANIAADLREYARVAGTATRAFLLGRGHRVFPVLAQPLRPLPKPKAAQRFGWLPGLPKGYRTGLMFLCDSVVKRLEDT